MYILQNQMNDMAFKISIKIHYVWIFLMKLDWNIKTDRGGEGLHLNPTNCDNAISSLCDCGTWRPAAR